MTSIQSTVILFAAHSSKERPAYTMKACCGGGSMSKCAPHFEMSINKSVSVIPKVMAIKNSSPSNTTPRVRVTRWPQRGDAKHHQFMNKNTRYGDNTGGGASFSMGWHESRYGQLWWTGRGNFIIDLIRNSESDDRDHLAHHELEQPAVGPINRTLGDSHFRMKQRETGWAE